MIKNPVVVDKILKKLQTDYVKIEEERNKYQENLKSKKVQKKIIDRQTYIQNIEKKLNEIVAHSLEIKKQDKKPNFSLSHKNLPSMEMDEPKIINDMKIKQNSLSRAEKVKLNLFLQEKRMMKSKTRLCRLLFSTGICRWGDKCNFAHNIKEIEGEYRPKGFFFFFLEINFLVWVSNFQSSAENFKLRPKTQESFNKTTSFRLTAADGFCIDRIINKVNEKWLIKYNNNTFKKGRTLLHENVIKSDYEEVRKLVMSGASVTKQDWYGCDSIIYAIKKNEMEIVSLLLDFSKTPIDLKKKFFVKLLNIHEI